MEIEFQAPHAIDAMLSPWPRRLDGVEAHEGPRNISQDNLTHLLISTQLSTVLAHRIREREQREARDVAGFGEHWNQPRREGAEPFESAL